MKALSIITLILFMTPAVAGSPLYQKSGGYENSGGYGSSGGYEKSGGYGSSGGYETIRGVDITATTFKSNAQRNANRRDKQRFEEQIRKVDRTQGDYIRNRHIDDDTMRSLNTEVNQQGGTRER